MKDKTIGNPGKSLLKLRVAALVLVATFCTAAQAQIVSEASHTNLGDGVILDSVFSIEAASQSSTVRLTHEGTGIVRT
jgi:hypothetical protein